MALNAEAAVTSFARGAVQRAQMTAPDPAAVVVVAALASCGANRDERRNPNGDNASFCTEYVEQLDPLWKASLVDDDHWHYDVFSCKSSEKQVGSISSDYAQTGSFDLNDKATWSWHYIRKLGKLGAEAMMYEKFNGSGSTYVRAAFVSPSSAGVYAPWRGGNLDDGANCGLPCANGNNGPGTANWNGVPRHADDKIALKRA